MKNKIFIAIDTGSQKKASSIIAQGRLQAKLANKAKLDAIVCSPHEVKSVKKYFYKEIITPGIRISSKVSDQKRVMSPKDALKQGSDWLVIGRDITKGNIRKNFKKLSDHLSQ